MNDTESANLTPREKAILEQNPDAEIINQAAGSTASKQLVGVGGWLAFLVAVLFVIGPFLSLIMTFGEVSSTEREYPELVGNELWANIKVVIWATLGAQIATRIYAGYRLNSRKVAATVPIVIACLWFMGPVLNFVAFAIVSSMSSQSSDGTNEVAVEIFRSVFTATLWTAYLLLSRRVKNTYRGNV